MLKTHIFGFIPTRFIIAVQIFLACAIAYMIRVYMSINLIAMVETPSNKTAMLTLNNSSNTSITVNSSIHAATSVHGEPIYYWDRSAQGYILQAFFWGYTISSLPAGTIAEKCGARNTITVSALVSGLLTLLVPVAATWHYISVVIIRLVQGLLGGLFYPSMQCLIAHWAPPQEKSKFMGALMGSSIGTVITFPLLGAIISAFGWTWAYYVPGIIVFLWSVMWFYTVTDYPADHPRINDKERIYIMEATEGVKRTKGLPPYKSIALSIPFWALTVLHFGSLWGLFFLMTAGPEFMSSVLGFNIKESGVFSALPYLARMIFGFFFAYIADVCKQRNWMSIALTRKTFVVFSHVIPGLFLIIQTLTGCDITWAVVLITLSLGFNGASTVTNLANPQDLAPSYAGSVYGIASCIAGTSGFISPNIVTYYTKDRSGLEEWHKIFYIGASVYIASGVVFWIFGSGDVQPWNNTEEDKPETNKNGIDNAAFQSTDSINKATDQANTKV